MFFMGWIWPQGRGVGWWFFSKGSCFMDFLPRERWPQPAEVQAEIEGDLITLGELWLKEPPQTLRVSHQRMNGHLDTAGT